MSEGHAWVLAIVAVLVGLGALAGGVSVADGRESEIVSTLHERANDALEAMIAHYWDDKWLHFHKYSDGRGWTDFWWQAQAWDAVMDGVVRGGGKREKWLEMLHKVYEGQKKRTPTFKNEYYDDEAWWALACLRAYELTGREEYLRRAVDLWGDIKQGYSADLGGAIWWRKDRHQEKNACINGPAAIIAARMYDLFGKSEDLEMARKLYAWIEDNLLSPSNLVWDHVTESGVVYWTFTYNQGTFIGAAVWLYKVTGEQGYLEQAKRVADAVIKLMTDDDGVLKEKGNGDGGGFKGIFIRYLLSLTRELPEADRRPYKEFILANAESAWNKARTDEGLFGSSWAGPAPTGPVESLTNVSGVVLMNLAAIAAGM